MFALKNSKVLSIIRLGCLYTLLLSSLQSCSGTAGSASFGTPLINSSGIIGVSNGVTDDNQFYVGIDSNTNPSAHVHDVNGFSLPCSISPTETAHKDINCIIDVPESDLFVSGLALKYNIPKNLCPYLVRSTYWYYNQEVGYGPVSIQMNINQTTTIDNGISNTVINSRSCSVDGAAAVPCSTAFPEVTISEADQAVKCAYDKTPSVNGANCCLGAYQWTVVTTETSGGGLVTSKTETRDWGGSYAACMGGAGVTNWEAKDSRGLPMQIVEPARTGINSTYKVSAPIDTTSSFSVLPVANYYKTTAHSHTGFGPVLSTPLSSRLSTKPYYVDPIDDRNGTLILPGNDSYEFVCRDEAWEMIHRIRVQVRKWDTVADFQNYIASAGTGEPDRSGDEPDGCSGIEGPCNDFFDAGDFVASLTGGIYNMTAPSIPLRWTYFPNLVPKK